MVNPFVTFASFQLFISDVEDIYDAITGLAVNKEIPSFPWSSMEARCLVLFAVKNIMVLLLMCRVYVLLVKNVKAKVFKEYSAGFPCYSLLHSFEVETEEYKVDMLNDKLVVRNEITMAYLFPALRARLVV